MTHRIYLGTGAGFNCTANLTVTTVTDVTPSSAAGAAGAATAATRYEALLVNHPTGVVNMRLSPYLPPVAVTITFSGSAMPVRSPAFACFYFFGYVLGFCF